MLLSFYSFGLLISFASFTTSKIAGQKHHKVRHKHNSFNLRGNHVNEIREAFDQYRSVLQNTWHQDQLIKYPQIKDVDISDEYDEPIDNNLKFNSWESSRRDANKQKAGAYNHQQPRLVPAPSSDYFLRNKRIYTTTSSTTTRRTTTTLRSIDNDDYDYDDDNDTSNRRLNDDAQVDSVRPNRDHSDNQNQPAEGESLTDFKMKTLGTVVDVRNSFQREMNNQNRNGQDVNHHIRQNMMRTKIEGMCRWANKKVIEMPQQASKIYTPRKYVIYQCSDDTACCGSSDKTCVAKKTEELVLWFHVRFVDATGVEPLKVVNHTECECIYKNRPSTLRPTRLAYSWPMPATTTTTKAPTCKCPSHFDAEDDDGICGCVCKDSKVECRQRYEGKEGFTMSDQRCILHKGCLQPHCLYGTYSSDSGRCPDKNDKINRGFHGSTRAT